MQTIVKAGTVSSPVRVNATVQGSTPVISSTSDNLVVSTGIPDQNSFSIAASKLNIWGWEYDGTTSDITVRLADHFNNPVPNGTAVSFMTSGGSVTPSCFTTNGACTVTLTSQDPRPPYVCTQQPCPCPWDMSSTLNCPVGTIVNGRAVVTAYALGEESFVDLNGNGIFDAGVDTFTDRPEPFSDVNEDGVRSATVEPFVDTNGNGLYNGADGIYNGILRNASITGPSTIHVWKNIPIAFSSTSADPRVTNFVLGVPGIKFFDNNLNKMTLDRCNTATKFNNDPKTFYIHVPDINGNALPVGTQIKFSTTNGKIISPTSYTVLNQSSKMIADINIPVIIESDATQSGSSAPYTCTNAAASGLFSIEVSFETTSKNTFMWRIED